MPMLRWIIVLRLQQRCKELRNNASSQLEAINAVWCKLIEYCSQMPNKRFTNAGLEAISESQLRRMQPVHTDVMTRTIIHSLCMSDFLFFSEKNQNVCVRTTRNIAIKNDGLTWYSNPHNHPTFIPRYTSHSYSFFQIASRYDLAFESPI